MFFSKLTYPLVLAVLFMAGLAFIVTPATAQTVTPVLSVVDEDTTTPDEQVYGIRAESVSFELTVTFQTKDINPVKTSVTGFKDATDIQLYAADSRNNIIPDGATAAPIQSNADGSVYTTKITVKGNINKVIIRVPADAAKTLPTLVGNLPKEGVATLASDPDNKSPLVVNIVRSAAPPLTLSPNKFVGGNAPFTVTLTATTAITLTRADLKVIGGSIDSLLPDATKRIWTVAIRPGVAIKQLTVEPSETGAYIFPKGTFTVDTTGPAAAVTGTPPVGGGAFVITIAFDEPLQTGATLLTNEITVGGGSIDVPIAIANTNTYVATLTPDPSATTVTVQVNASAVADAGGIQNTATPSVPHAFKVAATADPPVTVPTDDKVTISEIMFAADGSTNDIQWIELFNSSKTQAVALDAGDGWEVIIENYDDPDATGDPLSGTINFKESGNVKTIPPRQAVLIASSNGRNSDSTHFVSTRVFKVYSELAAEFGMNTRRDPFLHPTQGFHIRLVDGRNTLADEVGNLDGRIRTADEPAWELPNGWTADGDRTSIIRRYREYRNGRYFNKGTVRNGTEPEGWILAARTAFADFSKDNETWYGSPDDYGTPGLRAGHALPVQLSQFRPELTETGTIVIHWTTESEVDNAGFNILRSQTKTGEFKGINAQLIPGTGTTAERNTYTWTDTTAKPNVVYYYQIEDVSFAGERQTLATVRLRGLISAKGKLTTQWGELKKSRD